MKGKKILIGVCGSIAAYKTALLIRLLVKAGAEVKVIMTHSATDFITPLTLSTLSKNPVGLNYFNTQTGEWANHVEYGLWADVFIVAPATANTLGKMANGICDNLLIASYLSAKCPVFFAPAMDLDMYIHPSTKRNIDLLKSYGNQLIEVGHGELASGLSGDGRMEEPEIIFETLRNFFLNSNSLKGKKVLVTAGPTYEAIDPVRFVGNRSSGKMGFAIADQLALRGAEVKLVSGPTSLKNNNQNIQLIMVESAEEMFTACMADFSNMDVIIMSAAVADYKPMEIADQKIKKKSDELSINLVPTQDILKQMGVMKKGNQFLVGFALETENEVANANDKLSRKNLDLIVLNSLNDIGAGFNSDTNKITIINKAGQQQSFEMKSKNEVAKDLVNVIVESITK